MNARSVIAARQIVAAPRATARAGTIPPGTGLKHKDLTLVPERLAIALQDVGWYVRQRVAWRKTAPMPESVQDRPISAWEHVWLLYLDTFGAHWPACVY